jgi:hypothetical protein
MSSRCWCCFLNPHLLKTASRPIDVGCPITFLHNADVFLRLTELVTLLAGPIKKLKLSLDVCRFMALYYPHSMKRKYLHNVKTTYLAPNNSYSFGQG